VRKDATRGRATCHIVDGDIFTKYSQLLGVLFQGNIQWFPKVKPFQIPFREAPNGVIVMVLQGDDESV